MEQMNIQNSISELKRLQILNDQIKEEIKKHEVILKDYMLKNSLDTLYGNTGEKVQYVEVASNRFDVREFKKQFTDLYNLYLKTVHNFRFKITY